MCVGVKSFFPISPYQDSFSEGQWKVAEEAAVTAKVREVWLEFNIKSTQRRRAVHTLTAGLTRSTFVRVIKLRHVPVDMHD